MGMNLRERLIDPKSPDRRPRKAAYALPTLFTAGNLFLGFLAIVKRLRELGVEDLHGHLLFKISAAEYGEANAWLARTGVMQMLEESVKAWKAKGRGRSRR